jgi:predicted Zn finger-like uncharacterized protein
MIIFCDECGERYVIEKKDIKEKVIVVDCRICHNLIKVRVPDYEVKNPPGSKITRG